MKYTLKTRYHSPKDYSHHKSHLLGAAMFAPNGPSLLTPVLDQGDTDKCTAASSVAVRGSEVNGGNNFDLDAFWSDELSFSGVQNSNGFDIEVPAAVGVETGFCKPGEAVRGNRSSAYYWITPHNGLDWFDSIRLAIESSEYPVSAGMDWYEEYSEAVNGVMQDNGKNLLGGHCIKIAGWNTIAGVPYLLLQNSGGTSIGSQGIFYMPRDLANKAFAPYGVFMWSDNPTPYIARLGYLSALLVNVKTLLKTLLS